MQRIERLIDAKVPFAVMQYKKTPAGLPRNTFELVVFNPSDGELNVIPVDPLDVKLLKSRKFHGIIKLKNKTPDGQVYEFMDFKKLYDDTMNEFKRLMTEFTNESKN